MRRIHVNMSDSQLWDPAGGKSHKRESSITSIIGLVNQYLAWGLCFKLDWNDRLHRVGSCHAIANP